MALTYFYAELFGLMMVIMALAMVANRRAMMVIMREVLDSRAILFVIAFVSLFIGLLIVLTHNIWNQGLVAVLVTLVGWALILRAVIIFYLPHGTVRKLFRAFTFEQTYYATFIIVLVVGAYLAYSGFMAFGA